MASRVSFDLMKLVTCLKALQRSLTKSCKVFQKVQRMSVRSPLAHKLRALPVKPRSKEPFILRDGKEHQPRMHGVQHLVHNIYIYIYIYTYTYIHIYQVYVEYLLRQTRSNLATHHKCMYLVPQVIYTHTYIHTCVHTYIHTYIQTYLRMYIPTHIHAYIHTYIHSYIRTYLRMYIPTHTYIHTYIHTCLPTYLLAKLPT